MKTFRGKLWFGKLFLVLAKKQSGPKDKYKEAAKGAKKKKSKTPEMSGGVMDLIGGLTVLRFTSMLGMRNISFTKEELLKLNSQLNKIKKPS